MHFQYPPPPLNKSPEASPVMIDMKHLIQTTNLKRFISDPKLLPENKYIPTAF